MATLDTDDAEGEKRILGVFVAGLAEHLESPRAEELQRELGAIDPPEVGEREMAVRCLNAGVDAWRDAVGGTQRTMPIKDAEDAYDEWEFMGPIVVDGTLGPAKSAVREALLTTSEALGPYPGGEPAAFREPTERARTVEGVEPRPVDLRLIATRSGQALGLLGERGSVDPTATLQKLIAGSD